ncbi:hypothetical protein V6N13_128983 [Hibiscus sabdariffa]
MRNNSIELSSCLETQHVSWPHIGVEHARSPLTIPSSPESFSSSAKVANIFVNGRLETEMNRSGVTSFVNRSRFRDLLVVVSSIGPVKTPTEFPLFIVRDDCKDRTVLSLGNLATIQRCDNEQMDRGTGKYCGGKL